MRRFAPKERGEVESSGEYLLTRRHVFGGAREYDKRHERSVGLSREYGNVSHDTLPYFCCRMPSAVGEQGGYWDLPGRVGKTYRGCCGKERPGSLVGKLAEVRSPADHAGPVVQTRSGLRRKAGRMTFRLNLSDKVCCFCEKFFIL